MCVCVCVCVCVCLIDVLDDQMRKGEGKCSNFRPHLGIGGEMCKIKDMEHLPKKIYTEYCV